MRFASFVLIAVAVCGWPASVEAGGIPPKILKELKAASVFIKVQFGGGGGKPVPATGSGFLLQAEGKDGYIVTNHHVVSPLADEIMIGSPKIVFHSGTPNEKIVDGLIVASDPIRDLAVLKVTTPDLPRPIVMNLELEASETMPVYAFGFPFGEGLALGKNNPAITITKGTISALRYDDEGDVKLLQIDAEINPGNSGGPLVDEKGNLLGVSVSKLVKARTVGFAIPLKPVAEMLQGKVAAVAFETSWVVKDQAEVSIDVALIDPLNKLKDLAIHYRPKEKGADLPRRDKAGTVPLMKDAKVLWLKVHKGRGVGRLTLPGDGRPKLDLAYQTSVVTAAGKTAISPGAVAAIDFTQVIYTDRLTPADPKLEGLPHKTFTHAMKTGKHFVVDMRGDPKDMDPKVIVRDASGKSLAQDDGGGGLFDALLVFSPPADGEYHVVATVSKGAGPFTLRIREDTGETLSKKGLNKGGTLKSSDALDRVKHAPAQTFNLFFTKGKHYAIDMKSADFDPYLRLESLANVNLKSEDVGGNGHSTLFFSPFRDSIYRIIATSYDLKVGRYDLQVREIPGPKQLEIPADGLKMSESLTLVDPLDVVNGKSSTFRCKVYELKLKAGQKYQIDLKSIQFDPFLRIEDMRGKQLAMDDDSGGNRDARLIFTAKTDGHHRLVVTQYDARVGAFELTAKALP